MRANSPKILLAFLLSLMVHAVMVPLAARYIHIGGLEVRYPRQPAEMTITLVDEPRPRLDELDLGAPDEPGYATHASEGTREQQAREAENDQADLSLDPSGAGSGGDVPTPQQNFLADGGRPTPNVDSAPAAVVSPSASTASTPFGVPTDQPIPKLPQSAVTLVGPLMAESVPPDEREAPPMVFPSGAIRASAPPDEPIIIAGSPVEAAAAAAAPAQPPPGARHAASADPAPKSDSESDPFSKLGSVEFRRGHLAVRSGRQVKPRRPKLTLAGKVSVLELQEAKVVLNVSIDATGKVTSAEIAQSSGRVEIDQPTRVAMYDWWFEPKKNAAGERVPDRFQFTINWR